MNNLTPAVGRAMVTQAKRNQRVQTPEEIIADLRVELAAAQRELKVSKEENKRLNAENDALALKAHRGSKVNVTKATSGKFHEGVAYVNQIEAAAILRVDQAQISRWVKAKKFTMISVPKYKKPQIVLASLRKPEPEKRGRKKK